MEEMPLRSGEASSLQIMYGVVQLFATSEQAWEKRLRAIGKLSTYRRLKTMSANMLAAILKTIPAEKKRLFEFNLQHQQMVIRSTGPAKEEGFTYVPSVEMIRLCGLAAEGCGCSLCDGTNEDMRKCQFYKCLNRTSLLEFEPKIGTCKWAGFDWKEALKQCNQD